MDDMKIKLFKEFILSRNRVPNLIVQTFPARKSKNFVLNEMKTAVLRLITWYIFY